MTLSPGRTVTVADGLPFVHEAQHRAERQRSTVFELDGAVVRGTHLRAFDARDHTRASSVDLKMDGFPGVRSKSLIRDGVDDGLLCHREC
jgi:hypothetical protein